MPTGNHPTGNYRDNTPDEIVHNYQRNGYLRLKPPVPVDTIPADADLNEIILDGLDIIFDLKSQCPTNQALIATVTRDQQLHVLGHPNLIALIEAQAAVAASDVS